MCGICGKVYYDRNRPVEKDSLVRMCDAIQHRGPDAHGYYLKGSVGLGSQRLSIIDVEGGNMPICNEDGTIWIVFNGEIYNFPQLREQLERRGHQFVSHSDTETVIHLYEEEGDDFVKSLNGMFALAIWDERRQRLVLARDHLGIKPLYYAQLSDRLVFASEIKAILLDGMERHLDPIALHDYLSLNYVPGPRSIFAGISKLQPGHLLVYEANEQKTHVREYWDLPLSDQNDPRFSDSDYVEKELLSLLRQIVQEQMVSDVPLGAFLSGGLDSSVIVALMSQVSNRPVQTFSVGFEEKSYSELPYAKIVAETFHTDHHEIVIQPRIHNITTAIAHYFDEPFADSSAVAVYSVSQWAAQNVKVALSGDGGDEVFGGYYTYQADKLAMLYRRLPRFLNRDLLPKLVDWLPASDNKASLDFKLRRFMAGGSLPPLHAHVAWKAYFDEEMKSQLYCSWRNDNSAFLRPTVAVFQKYYDRYTTEDLLNRLLYVDTKVQLVDDMLTKVDRMSMAHSLEVRVPLLDLRLVEFMSQVPSRFKIHRMTLKYLFKRIAAQLLPASILKRPKAGFSVPIARWLRTDLRDMVHDLLNPQAIAKQGVFEPEIVQSIVKAHFSGRKNHSHNIWNLLMFSLWYQEYMKPPLASTQPQVYRMRV